jgi:RNA polymerase sigma-70 factor, ECF subfamily
VTRDGITSTNDRASDHTHCGQQSAAQADSPRSFERDVLPLADDLCPVALRYTRNRADAEDLVQETLLKAFKAFKAFDAMAEHTHLKAWLLTIMRNAWISSYRAALRRPTVSLFVNVADHDRAIAPSAVPEEAASAEHHALRYVMDDEVRQAVHALLKEMRETVYLVAIEAMKCREAAEVLGISPRTVLSRMHRIRQRLRQPLADTARRRGLLA